MGDFLHLYVDSFKIVAILIASLWLVKVSTIKDKRYKKGEKIIDVKSNCFSTNTCDFTNR